MLIPRHGVDEIRKGHGPAGKLEEVQGRSTARMPMQRLTLQVRKQASGPEETAFRYAVEDGVGVFYWIDRDRGYAIASADLNRDELLKVADLVYKQLEP